MIEIAGRKIGAKYPPVVIAEIGINHEGSLVVAKEMVDAAFRAGVEIVKHQTHIVEDEMSGAAKKVIPGNSDVSIYEIMERCSLSEQEEFQLKEYVESKGMIFISTPFSRAAADRLRQWDVPAYKIGSGECNNYPLLEHIASFGKPITSSSQTPHFYQPGQATLWLCQTGLDRVRTWRYRAGLCGTSTDRAAVSADSGTSLMMQRTRTSKHPYFEESPKGCVAKSDSFLLARG